MENEDEGLCISIGLNYKDKRQDAIAWLKKYGNPFVMSASGLDGRVGIDWCVYCVPETFMSTARA